MKASSLMRAGVLALVAASLGCQEGRPPVPTAASLFVPIVDGVWSGPMTRVAASGLGCTTQELEDFLPVNDLGTLSVLQTGTDLLATMTTESTGLACRYSGSASVTGMALNASSCDRTGLLVACAGRTVRLELVGSSVDGSWNSGAITGVTSSTYNGIDEASGQGIGSLVVNHAFTATRR
jgi:hypothetical protein